MFRAQFPHNPPPVGFVYQPCIYQYDKNNVPALGSLALVKGQESGYIPLPTDQDATFIWMGAKVENGGVNVAFWDANGNPLMDTYIAPSEWAGELQPVTILEGPGIEIPPGGIIQVRFQGQ